MFSGKGWALMYGTGSLRSFKYSLFKRFVEVTALSLTFIWINFVNNAILQPHFDLLSFTKMKNSKH